MCPNCILNQAPLDSGMYVAFGICLLFFVVAVAAMLWALRNGDFEDIESSKFDMLDDSENGSLSDQARRAVNKTRQAKQNS